MPRATDSPEAELRPLDAAARRDSPRMELGLDARRRIGMPPARTCTIPAPGGSLLFFTQVEAPCMTTHRDNFPHDPHIRADLVARIRREILRGTYDTPEKLELALQQLLNEATEDDED